MSDYAQQIVTYLKTDVTLAAIVTGGVYNYPDTGRKGLTKLLAPVAFSEVDGMIKPAAVVLQLKSVNDNQIVNPTDGYNSTVTPINIWIYDRGTTDTGYENIKAAAARIYQLLAFTQLTNMFQILYDGTIKDKREPDLKEAAFYVVRFKVYGSESFT
jgi:hypothetical protein